MGVYKDGVLEKSTVVNDIFVDNFNTAPENTGGYTSWINVNNERQNMNTHNIFKSDLLDNNQEENKWCCAAETSAELYR